MADVEVIAGMSHRGGLPKNGTRVEAAKVVEAASASRL